jgi:hypothetical protein
VLWGPKELTLFSYEMVVGVLFLLLGLLVYAGLFLVVSAPFFYLFWLARAWGQRKEDEHIQAIVDQRLRALLKARDRDNPPDPDSPPD